MLMGELNLLLLQRQPKGEQNTWELYCGHYSLFINDCDVQVLNYCGLY